MSDFLKPGAVLALAIMMPMRFLAAQDFTAACHASSSYDVTLTPSNIVFDRAAPLPRRIELRGTRIVVDGGVLRASAEDTDRLALFEKELRALVPKVRRVANNGVDLAIRAVTAEAASFGPDADTLAAINARLATHGAEFKRRIAESHSTHDWQPDALDGYFSDVAADIVPLLAADLTRQAIATALSGDLNAAAELRERAAQLNGADLRTRLQRRMQSLQPQIEALCPSIRALYESQRGVRGPQGRPLDLLQIAAR